MSFNQATLTSCSNLRLDVSHRFNVIKPPPSKQAAAAPDFSTRAKRKKAAQAILEQLETLIEAAEENKCGIPESMYNRQEEAENDVTALGDAIAAIEELFSY